MSAPDNFTYFPAAMDPVMCDRIVQAGELLDFRSAVVATADGNNEVDVTRRQGLIGYFNDEPQYEWLFREIWSIVEQVNSSNWKFNITAIEAPQYSIYNEGHYFGWHRDTMSNHTRTSVGGSSDMTRKISMTIQLSDPSEYEGGYFDVPLDERIETAVGNLDDPVVPENGPNIPEALLPKGTILAFPSVVTHRVTPIKSGVRRSLVIWANGPPDDFDGY